MHKYKKGEYRDQFVIAYITNWDDYEDTVQWSIKFCNLLHKGLVLLFISDTKYTKISTSQAQKQLKQINSTIDLPYIHSYVALKGKTRDIINNLGDLLNAVIIVTKIYDGNQPKVPNHYNNIIKDFYFSRVAYFVFKTYVPNNYFHNVVLSMNALKECKEKILWASYFGRFANSITHIYYHRYKDDYLQRQLNLNIGFLRKMFRKFSIETLNVHSINRKTKLDVQALEYATKTNCDICIFQTTKNKSYIEFFTGLPERRVLQQLQSIPVLFLNQRDDLFVMCE
ncbi:MAG: hypothetical protein ACTTJH_03270 [Bacteroidales bacterium]